MRIHETIDFRSKATLYNFLEWWKDRTRGNVNEQDNTFLSKISVESDGTINCGWKIDIIDHRSTFLPFKFGTVASMRLQMKNLESLHNSPTNCQGIFSIESANNVQNDKLRSLVDCPQKVGHMSFELSQPLENLANSLTHPCESVWINVSEIVSFAGNKQFIQNLGLNLSNQKTLSAIKQLRYVNNLDITLPSDFSGGLLGLCLIPGLQSVSGGGEKTQHFAWDKALKVLEQGLAQKMNVHDVQELMIESGYRAFARL